MNVPTMRLFAPSLLAACALIAPPATGQGDWFMSGPERIDLEFDSSLLGVLFDDDIGEARAREILASITELQPTQAATAPYIAGKVLRLALDPGLSSDEALALAHKLGQRLEVRAAAPRLLAGVEPYYLTDTLLVRWIERTAPSAIAALEEELGLSPVGSLDFMVNPGVVYELPKGASLDAMLISRALHFSGMVEFAHPNFSLTRVAMGGTNDPLVGNQWHLHSVGQTAAKVDADVDALEAWGITTGDPNLIIAVVDTGMELGHPDLKLVQGIDVLDNDNDPSAEAGLFGGIFGFTENHATSVAGVIAARGNNGLGVSGASQNSKVMPIRFLSEANLFNQPTASDEADAFNFACQNGAGIINNSWGPAAAAPLLAGTKASIDNCVTNGRGGLGTMIFFAAGNSSANTAGNGYVTYVNTIAVSASNDQDAFSSYSNFGAAIDFCAPSNGGITTGIWTTDRLGSPGYSTTDYANNFGGTSSASPLAAGVAALVMSRNPSLTWSEVRQIMRNTADKISPASGNYAANGHSTKFGFGKVNAHQAVIAAGGGGGGDPCTAPVTYGSPDISTTGNTASIGSAGGDPSVSNPGFSITLSGANPNQGAFLVESSGQASTPVVWGTILVASPFIRHLSFTSAAGTSSYLVPMTPALNGQTLYWQWIIRDPGAGGVAHHSEGLQVTFCP